MTYDDGRDTSTHRSGLRLGAALLAVALLIAVPLAMATTGAAQPASQLPAEPAFLLVLEPDGSARATLTVVFDLSTASERNAFEALGANATARDQRVEQFASRMRAIADSAEATAGREMGIAEPTIEFVQRNDTGIVALSVTWEGLAARSGDSLVLGEPFESGFTIDRAFYVVGPDGYALESAAPTPTEQTPVMAMWSAETSLEGLEVTFVPDDGAIGDAPGFTVGLALLALLLAAGIAIRRPW